MTIQGTLEITNMRIAIVVARFNELVTARLAEGAKSAWERCGGAPDDLCEVYVPGAFEIPLAAQALAQSGQYDAVVCLGAVVRGATSHYDYVCSSAASGIAQVALKTDVPVIFGVLTTDTMEQALDRAGGKAGNKGAEAVLAAIETANVQRKIRLQES
jgi:6,7-dimethyl-8-ribityllumazine synthase